MTNPNQAPQTPGPDESAGLAPGFIDHVPTQDELLASAGQTDISELTLTKGAFQAIVEGRESGEDPIELNQRYPSTADQAPHVPAAPRLSHEEAIAQAPPAPAYEEPESERVISPEEHKALLQKLRDRGEI